MVRVTRHFRPGTGVDVGVGTPAGRGAGLHIDQLVADHEPGRLAPAPVGNDDRRVAEDGQLGESKEVDAEAARFADGLQYPGGVALEVPDGAVHLGHAEP